MFKKILIANRGEIACRIIATARKMGIQTVAVYSEADRRARHVALADEAVCIGAAPSSDSYLCAEKIIVVCQSTQTEAVHPGYGFLSENEAFARQIEEEGFVFIGPKFAAIAAMGDKIASKKLALQAGVNTIPGHNDAVSSAEDAVRLAQRIGYPVMIKASAGGGGKGLRIACNDQEALEGFVSCQNEARNSFGDDRIFIEKYIEAPRHIEIQVLADAYANVLYLHERECSIQRRHQKVIEEAPSPFISAATRKAMGEQAVALAKAVGYQSAGTVEFVVGKDERFYFLEMNTRLQVEHPVTELITGIDLVEWMIRIAAGEQLTLVQDHIPMNGWAMECRINAEDPYRGFLPSTGRLVHFQPPVQQLFASQAVPGKHGVRVDTGVQEGGDISLYYDSMIAKLIVHGSDRRDAIARMGEALNAFVVRGVASNIPFQSALLAHPDFMSGHFDTGFITRHWPDGFVQPVPAQDALAFLVALAVFWQHQAQTHRKPLPSEQFNKQQMGISTVDEDQGQKTLPLVAVVLQADGQHIHCPAQIDCLDSNHERVGIAVHGIAGISDLSISNAVNATNAADAINTYRFTLQSHSKPSDILLQGTCNGKTFNAQIDRFVQNNPLALRVQHNGAQAEIMVLSPRAAELYQLMPHKAEPDTSKYLLAPMPGLLTQIVVTQGQAIKAGEKLATIEAMKMENTLLASQDGIVKTIVAHPGESVAVDAVIIEFA